MPPFKVGPFIITPFLMDHSAFGASSLLIEAEGKKIFYTGDLRGHGRKAKLFEHLLMNPIQNVDCLLMEGTTLSGEHNVGYETEEAVESALYSLFALQEDASFVMSAGSNIDRLVSIYQAALQAKKILVVDLYQFYLLKQIKDFPHGLPLYSDKNLRILYLVEHAKTIANQVNEHLLYKWKSLNPSSWFLPNLVIWVLQKCISYNINRIRADGCSKVVCSAKIYMAGIDRKRFPC